MLEIKTKEELNSLIHSEEKFVVKFGAEWCTPCNMLAENIKVVEEKIPQSKFYSIDIDESEYDLVKEYNIKNIPVVLLFKNGEMVSRSVGLQSVEELEQIFK